MPWIERYKQTTLPSVRDILGSKGGLDLVRVMKQKKINLNYDMRRKLVRAADGSISPVTVPHADIFEMHRHRGVMNNIRKNGEEALPDQVLRRVVAREAMIRLRGGDVVTVIRLFLRGMIQQRFPAVFGSYQEVADALNQL